MSEVVVFIAVMMMFFFIILGCSVSKGSHNLYDRRFRDITKQSARDLDHIKRVYRGF